MCAVNKVLISSRDDGEGGVNPKKVVEYALASLFDFYLAKVRSRTSVPGRDASGASHALMS